MSEQRERDPFERWREQLLRWAIPPAILATAPESPWGFPVELFAADPDAPAPPPTPSRDLAMAALPEAGSVLDVGCGGGAASLPLLGRAARLVAVDEQQEMLDSLAAAVARVGPGVDRTLLRGSWTTIAGEVPPADVVVCHHVVYNVPDLRPFLEALTTHARTAVVVELTASHAMTAFAPLWRRFHQLERPTGPLADDLEAGLGALGIVAERVDWTGGPSRGFADAADLVAFVRRRLCLVPGRDAEIAEAIGATTPDPDGRYRFPAKPRAMVTFRWDGSATGPVRGRS